MPKEISPIKHKLSKRSYIKKSVAKEFSCQEISFLYNELLKSQLSIKISCKNGLKKISSQKYQLSKNLYLKSAVQKFFCKNIFKKMGCNIREGLKES